MITNFAKYMNIHGLSGKKELESYVVAHIEFF